MLRFVFSLTVFAALLALAGCDSSSSSRAAGAAASDSPVRFQVRGVLQRLAPDHRRAVIAHDDIAGYMKAMTMEFEVADPAEAGSLARGDVLTFRLSVTDTRSWIDEIRKTGHTELPASSPEPAATAAAALTNLPDVALIDHRGQPFRLRNLRGRTLGITFMFTRCPLPNFCPLMSRNFEALERELAATVPRERWRLLSITIDPANDTPEALARYAAGYEVDPEQWIFATGTDADIRQVGAAVGLEFTGAGGQINHNLRTVVVDPTGRIQRVFDGNDWRPDEVATEMRRAMMSGDR